MSPFPAAYRASGILLHITSLPAPFGIGDFGPTAKRWIDMLVETGQTWWQVLPLGPTGFGNCPYQLVSTFAGNPLLISPEWLVEEGMLKPSDLRVAPVADCTIDYDAVSLLKQEIIGRAWEQFQSNAAVKLTAAYEQFCQEQHSWLDDYALFECFRQKYHTGGFWNWPNEIAKREPRALSEYRSEFAAEYDRIRFGQFLVFRQIARLKDYARSAGLQLIGDLPFFVSPESSDVWANPELFLLDEQLRPSFVAGVPPDYFSPSGQLWGNPVYDWEAHRRTSYRWWLRRVRALLQQVDVIRLDHFRGFAAAWHVPAGADSALSGEWQPGPGSDFFRTMRKELGGLPFLAEDLGDITPDVSALRDEFDLTGMRVLQFAFDGSPDNPFLPGNYVHNTVAYTATHDNDTTRGWFESLTQPDKTVVRKFLQQNSLKSSDVSPQMVQSIWSSKAALAMAPLQDILNLGTEHRMNTPGLATDNWRWRCEPEMMSATRKKWLRTITEQTQRTAVATHVVRRN